MFGVPVTGITDARVTYWLAIDLARCLPWGNATRKGGAAMSERLGWARVVGDVNMSVRRGAWYDVTPAPLVPRRTSLRRRRPAHELGRALRRLPPLQPSRARGPRFHPDALPAVSLTVSALATPSLLIAPDARSAATRSRTTPYAERHTTASVRLVRREKKSNGLRGRSCT